MGVDGEAGATVSRSARQRVAVVAFNERANGQLGELLRFRVEEAVALVALAPTLNRRPPIETGVPCIGD